VSFTEFQKEIVKLQGKMKLNSAEVILACLDLAFMYMLVANRDLVKKLAKGRV